MAIASDMVNQMDEHSFKEGQIAAWKKIKAAMRERAEQHKSTMLAGKELCEATQCEEGEAIRESWLVSLDDEGAEQ